MTHRERVLAAHQHRQPDRIPLDFGSNLASTITAQAHERLRAHLGLQSDYTPTYFAKRSGTVIPDVAILERFDIDTRGMVLGGPEGRPEQTLEGGRLLDEWSSIWAKPSDGHYINVDGPFNALAEPTVEDLEKIVWPDPSDPGRFRGLSERAKALHEGTDCAVVMTLGVGPVHQAQFMRGYAEWLADLIANEKFATALFDRITDIWVEIADRALNQVGQNADIAMFGDDVATQRGPLMRPDLYRKIIKPRHKRMVEVMKKHGKLALYHCCGSVYSLLGDFIDIGMDALNPTQVAAAHMDTKRLKQEFGRDITFWGGVDTQNVMPRGTPQQVREEVKRRLDDLGDGGGYVLAAVHNIQADVPPENVVSLFEAALEFGR